MYKGSMVALVTPLTQQNVDFPALEKLLEWHCNSLTQAIVILGTTGEAPVFSMKQREQIIRFTVKYCKQKLPVIVGNGSNNLQSALAFTQQAIDCGADTCLAVTPYYNKPTQQGLYDFFSELAKCKIPQILYNVPSRTGCDLLPQTIARLVADFSQVYIGVKEASGDLMRPYLIKSYGCEVALFSGDDNTAVEFMALGGDGVISVLSNVMPDVLQQCYQNIQLGKLAEARRKHHQVRAIIDFLSIETNPIPVKALLAAMGRISKGITLPLTWLDAQYDVHLKLALKTIQQLELNEVLT